MRKFKYNLKAAFAIMYICGLFVSIMYISNLLFGN